MKDLELIEYLKKLKCSKKRKGQLGRLIEMAEAGRVRDYGESDWLFGASVVKLETKGHMPRRTFHGFSIYYCDTSANLKRQALVYLKHRHLADGKAEQFRYGSHRVLVLEEGNRESGKGE